MTVKALLFDTQSIQRYIFSGTRLRTNIGASYIVDRLFDEILADILEREFPECNAKGWREAEENFNQLENGCRLAYSGGGNAMVLFAENVPDERIHGIVTEFSEQLLTKAPGLHTGVAMGSLDFGEAYAQGIHALYKQLKHHQNTVQPKVSVPYTGLTLTCKVNGETANHYGKLDDSDDYFFSQETACKENSAEQAARTLLDEYSNVLGGCVFPMSLDELGQAGGENYIAIVHADGNRMGKRFDTCTTLKQRVVLSKKVRAKTKIAFRGLLAEIAAEKDTYQAKGLELCTDREDRIELPIRPIIIGGDDITFICAGRMALVYAKRFLELMMEDGDATQQIDCCAGVAILPTSYPFFRGYELAEQLCDAAKAESRGKEKTSWLDFALLHGEQAPTLSQIRAQEYTGVWVKELHFGPYQVGAPKEHFSLDKLFQLIHSLRQQPSNKVKELRGILQRGPHDLQKYKSQQQHLGRKLPVIAGWESYINDFVSGRVVEGKKTWQTPFVDAIEMMDFMPKEDK